MQRALVHFSGGNYDELVVRDQHLRCFIRHAHTANLLKNTEYSPELIRTLHSKYASWVLILNEPGALLVGYNVNGCTLVHGETSSIIDWINDVITRPCSNPVRYSAHKLLADIFNLPSVSTLWEYLYLFNFIPQLSGCETLHLVQTGNGTGYWGCFLPTTYLQ